MSFTHYLELESNSLSMGITGKTYKELGKPIITTSRKEKE